MRLSTRLSVREAALKLDLVNSGTSTISGPTAETSTPAEKQTA
jgi:hypothetical protein